MLEVYCPRRSQTARELQEALWEFPEAEGEVNWSGAPREGALNARSRTDKLSQLTQLTLKGVSVPFFSLTPKAGWLGRTRFHQQGRDFTRRRGVRNPDFWVPQLNLEDEWRLHFIRTPNGNLKLLRSGLKLPSRPDFHPWVKSHRLGWKLSYVGGAPEAHVAEARKAMAALQLDFGAVDISTLSSGDPVVLEVNTCPGLEAPTLQRYVEGMVALAKERN